MSLRYACILGASEVLNQFPNETLSGVDPILTPAFDRDVISQYRTFSKEELILPNGAITPAWVVSHILDYLGKYGVGSGGSGYMVHVRFYLNGQTPLFKSRGDGEHTLRVWETEEGLDYLFRDFLLNDVTKDRILAECVPGGTFQAAAYLASRNPGDVVWGNFFGVSAQMGNAGLEATKRRVYESMPKPVPLDRFQKIIVEVSEAMESGKYDGTLTLGGGLMMAAPFMGETPDATPFPRGNGNLEVVTTQRIAAKIACGLSYGTLSFPNREFEMTTPWQKWAALLCYERDMVGDGLGLGALISLAKKRGPKDFSIEKYLVSRFQDLLREGAETWGL